MANEPQLSKEARWHDDENRITCGPCGTEFDLNKNSHCPLCGFGSGIGLRKASIVMKEPMQNVVRKTEYSLRGVPEIQKLESGSLNITAQARSVGVWGQFNSYFPAKGVARVLANLIAEEKSQYVPLDCVVKNATAIFNAAGLTSLRGFPKAPHEKSSVGRLVWHFISTFHDMGMFRIKGDSVNGVIPLNEKDWGRIRISLTREGYEFAKLPNSTFDNGSKEQVLTAEERKWLLNYMRYLDTKGFHEYRTLSAVWKFINGGKNGKNDLQDWFKTNNTFVQYVKDWSRKTGDKPRFEKQLTNLAAMFASSKIALLRELGIISNKRNEYRVLIKPEE